ncbi:MAG: hypothetical protein ACOC0P_06470, partial [Planctomycetota bacterium]
MKLQSSSSGSISESSAQRTATSVSPASSAKRVSSISPKTADEVFLSPKVIDCESYEDFAGALKELINQAGGLMRDLDAKVSEANGIADRLRTDGARHQERLNLGGRLLRTVSSEIERVERTADETLARFDARGDQLKSLEEEGEHLVRRFGKRLSAAEHEAEDRLNRLGDEAAGDVNDAIQRLEASTTRWDELQATIDQRLNHVERELNERLAPVSERMTKLMAEAEGLIGTMQDDSTEHADTDGDDQQDGSGGVSASASLADVLGEIRPILLEVNEAKDEAASLREQWMTLRREAAEELLTAADLVDTLVDRRAAIESASEASRERAIRMIEELNRQTAACEHARAETADELKRDMASHQDRLASAQEHTDQLMARLESTRTELEELLQIQGEASSRMSRLVEQIDPWKPILNDVYNEGELPPPLLRVVERVNSSVGTQLHTLSRVLRAMSSQVERAAGVTREQPGGSTDSHVANHKIHRQSDAAAVNPKVGPPVPSRLIDAGTRLARASTASAGSAAASG